MSNLDLILRRTRYRLRPNKALLALTHGGAISRVGSRFTDPLLKLASFSDEAAEAVRQFRIANELAQQGASHSSLGIFERQAKEIERIMKTLPAEEQSLFPLSVEVERRRISLETKLETAETGGVATPIVKTRGLGKTYFAFNAEPLSNQVHILKIHDELGNLVRELKGAKFSGELRRRQQYIIDAVEQFRSLVPFEDIDGWQAAHAFTGRFLNEITGSSSNTRAGYLRNIAGSLNESYCRRWPNLLELLSGHKRLATVQARGLGPEWRVYKAADEIRMNNRKTWDEGIYIVQAALESGQKYRELLPHATVEMATEEGISSKLLQTLRSEIRMADSGKGTAPLVSIVTSQRNLPLAERGIPSNEVKETFRLGNRDGVSHTRYVINSQGSDIDKEAVEALKFSGHQVNQLYHDMHHDQFSAIRELVVEAAARAAKKK